MGILDNVADRARTTISEWTGYTLASIDEVTDLREQAEHMGFFTDEVEDMAAMIMDYLGGRPHEVQAAHRRLLAQQSRIALIHDPTAGAEANLRANFAFGKGISMPQAKDTDVQHVITESWTCANNERKLTGYEAQRHRSNEMLTTANLFITIYSNNGKVRVGFRDADDVTDVVTDPEDDETPLYYVVRKRRVDWNFEMGQYIPVLGQEFENGREKVWYVKHWRNVTDMEKWCEETGEKMPPGPPEKNLLPGEIEHFRINRIGRSQFGVPPWARTLRYYTALNAMTEAQVQMRQGAATIIAQRVRKSGGPRDLLKTVSGVMARTGDIGARGRRYAEGGPPATAGPGTNPSHGAPPPPAASWMQSFEHDRLEAVNLRSGAGEALQDAQIIRAPIAAASGFGQHYLGDASSANLASATVLELPTMMEVSSWQETFEQIFRWFTDRSIEAAVHAGLLGGMIAESATGDTRSLTELHFPEDREEMEARTGKDLSYTFQMPYPGRRNLPDVTAAVASTLLTIDPAGTNWPLREKMIDFLMRHGFDAEDPGELVEEIMQTAKRQQKERQAEQSAREQEEKELRIAQINQGVPEEPEGNAPPRGPATSKQEREGEDNSPGTGAKMKSLPASREMGGGPRTREVLLEQSNGAEFLDALMADARAAWAETLSDPALLTANGDTARKAA